MMTNLDPVTLGKVALRRVSLLLFQEYFLVLRGIVGKSRLTDREAGKLAVAKHTLHLSLLSPCILLILLLSGQATTS